MLGSSCCCGCEIFSDDFARSSYPTVPGTNWSIQSGTWTVESQYLTTADLAAIILVNQSHSEMEHIVNGTIYGDPLDVVGIIVGYKDDNNYYFVEIKFAETDYTDGFCGYVVLYQKIGGTATELARIEYGPSPNTDNVFNVCLSAEEKSFSATVGDVKISHTWTTVPFTDGYQVGILAITAVAMRVKNFSWDKHYSTANPNCVNCADLNSDHRCTLLAFVVSNEDINEDIPCYFVEQSGDWHIIGPPDMNYTKILTCEDSTGLIYCAQPEPTYSNRQYINLTMWLRDAGSEAGGFIAYNPSNGNRILGTAEFSTDGSITFRLYENGTLIDQDTQIFYGYQSGYTVKVYVEICLDFDGTNVTMTYRATLFYYSAYFPAINTSVHSMYILSAAADAAGYYTGFEIVSCETVNKPALMSLLYTRHKTNVANCYECDPGCPCLTLDAPCYLKFDMSNFKDNTAVPCHEYPEFKECEELNGIFYAEYLGDCMWSTAVWWHRGCWYWSEVAWQAELTYQINPDTGTWQYMFYVAMYPRGYGGEEEYVFVKWFETYPDIFSWSDENIPYVGDPDGFCNKASDPPVCLVSNGNLDVP